LTRFGESSQFGAAEFAKTLVWIVPNTLIGIRDADSTLISDSSATWVRSISSAACGSTGC
jgi:hypothetical protein